MSERTKELTIQAVNNAHDTVEEIENTSAAMRLEMAAATLQASVLQSRTPPSGITDEERAAANAIFESL